MQGTIVGIIFIAILAVLVVVSLTTIIQPGEGETALPSSLIEVRGGLDPAETSSRRA